MPDNDVGRIQGIVYVAGIICVVVSLWAGISAQIAANQIQSNNDQINNGMNMRQFLVTYDSDSYNTYLDVLKGDYYANASVNKGLTNTTQSDLTISVLSYDIWQHWNFYQVNFQNIAWLQSLKCFKFIWLGTPAEIGAPDNGWTVSEFYNTSSEAGFVYANTWNILRSNMQSLQMPYIFLIRVNFTIFDSYLYNNFIAPNAMLSVQVTSGQLSLSGATIALVALSFLIDFEKSPDWGKWLYVIIVIILVIFSLYSATRVLLP